MKLIRISDNCVLDFEDVYSYELNASTIKFKMRSKEIIVAEYNNKQEAEVVYNNVTESTIVKDVRFAPLFKLKEGSVEDRRERGFEMFWGLYDKKVDRPKAYITFMNLTLTDMALAIKGVEIYIKSTPNKKYRKNPRTWLNARGWESEITKDEEDVKKTNRYIKPNYITDER